VFAAFLVDRLLNLPSLLPEGARLPVSIPVMAVGVTVTTWSAFHFLKVKGTPAPFNPPPGLVGASIMYELLCLSAEAVSGHPDQVRVGG
jgi:hypothetical protein